ncbi:4-(cytidine 5'-diphospho)-2-C-methyl-D-erythritol kinase [Jannaschia sp. 2305UL9-9]|uniref:4-(cytidine 5'-diphospho)-2-C-methyl-D-erythritol kinase n=1 Tax=Jannaschia sp. 2305UL9-9 TaxID=3121638 RepID=UPI00352841E0
MPHKPRKSDHGLHVFAPAKVNLTLHVTGRRADGYHLLDSLVAFADVGDDLYLSPGRGLTVTGPFAAGVPTDDRNLILRALSLAGVERSVRLDKHLPHPGGIGGGSSDAAAALRVLDVVPQTADLLRLGADLPVCLPAIAARMRGIGEVVEPVRLSSLHAVLLHPGVACPTGAVFAALKTTDNPGHDSMPTEDGVIDWLAAQRNDLERPAISVAPEIETALAALRDAGARIARMSGSGATCFGLFPTAQAAADGALALDRPGWWVRACTLS